MCAVGVAVGDVRHAMRRGVKYIRFYGPGFLLDVKKKVKGRDLMVYKC